MSLGGLGASPSNTQAADFHQILNLKCPLFRLTLQSIRFQNIMVLNHIYVYILNVCYYIKKKQLKYK